jgi:hypothetical protein
MRNLNIELFNLYCHWLKPDAAVVKSSFWQYSMPFSTWCVKDVVGVHYPAIFPIGKRSIFTFAVVLFCK